MANITIKTGNAVSALLDGEIDYLLHQCNAQGVMGSGIAKEIKERVPAAYSAYSSCYKTAKEQFGETLPLGSLSIGGNVINMVSQEHYGRDGRRYTNYGAVARAMTSIPVYMKANKHIDYVEQIGTKSIGIPYLMGCGLGGGDWGVVMELIEHLVSPYWKEVIIYKL